MIVKTNKRKDKKYSRISSTEKKKKDNRRPKGM